MKILVIGDLHGVKPRIHFKEFDCIIQVGDVCSDKEFRPHIEKAFRLMKHETRVAKRDVLGEIGKRELNGMINRSIAKGREILEYLNSFGVPVFFVPGNWDESYGKTMIKDMEKNDYNYSRTFLDYWLGRNSNKKLIQGLENVYDLQYRLADFGDVNFLGYGLVSGPESFKKKLATYDLTDRQREILIGLSKEIPRRLSKLNQQRDRKFPLIFVSHNIPHGVLDKCGQKKNYAYGKHLGSTVARDFCLRYKPLICIGGHVHEHYGKKKLGNTVVINAGFGRNANVLIDLDEKKRKIRKIKFVKGYKVGKN
jgi:Icc-related predicted phosphoesterase